MTWKMNLSPFFSFFVGLIFLFGGAILCQPVALASGRASAAGSNGDALRDELCRQLPVSKKCVTAWTDHWTTPPENAIEVRNGVKIKTRNGEVIFRDVMTPGSDSLDAKYQFIGYLAKYRYFLVSGVYYGEEQDFKLVSYESGGIYALRGRPVLAPKDDLFFVIPRWHGSVTTNIELYRIDVDTVAKVDTWDFGPCSATTGRTCDSLNEAIWVSPSEVAVFAAAYVRKGAEQVRTFRYLGSVEREGDRWMIHKGSSK